MPTQTSRNLSAGKTMVTAKVATPDVLAAKARAEAEGKSLTDVVARHLRTYGKGKPNKKEPAA